MEPQDGLEAGRKEKNLPQRRLTLAELREKVGEISKLDPPEGWQLPGLEGQVKRGSLLELLGNDRQEWLLSLFLAYPETRLAWVSPHLEIFPTALAQRGVKLSRCLFLETKRELGWSLLQVLRSGLFAFVICPSDVIPARNTSVFLRRLQLVAERSHTTLFFLSEQATPAFGLSYRIEVNLLPASHEGQAAVREIRVLKQKGSSLQARVPGAARALENGRGRG